MTTSLSLHKKLLLKPGQRILVLNAPADYRARIEPLPDSVEVAEQQEGNFDWVQLFVNNLDELDRWFPIARDAVKYDALLWICYPKGGKKAGTDLNRDILWRAVSERGMNAVTQIAIDETWSALRFRPTERVGR
jgi:hypothetical protein